MELQHSTDKVPPNVIMIVLGDFNVRVGVLDCSNGLWRDILGRHGMKEKNQAGEELLEFYAVNDNEHVVSKEGNISMYLDPSCYQKDTYDRLCNDESGSESVL